VPEGIQLNEGSRALRIEEALLSYSIRTPVPHAHHVRTTLLHYRPRILSVGYARLQSFPDCEIPGQVHTGGDKRVKECPR